MKPGADGKFPYSGVPDAFIKTIRREGFFGLWVSLPVFLCRLSPHAMIVFKKLNYLLRHF